nr:homeodomain-like protein [Tanacetum cinerariifolium]
MSLHEFDLFFDLEENSKEEVAGTMPKTIEEYMSKTRGDYGSGVTRTKIDAKDHFELKSQRLKELLDNTFNGLDHEDANEHIEKVLEIVNLFHIPNITEDQEVILFYNRLDVPTRQILDSKGAIPTKTDLGASVSVMPLSTYLNLDKIKFNWRNELGNFVNAPVFIGNFYVITDFKVVEDMDPYLDKGIEDLIVGEPSCKALCVEARRFDGIITIRDGDDSITYQMVRSNPRFKHLTNEKCNKILPLLKVTEQDKINEIPHSYQKLKGFYKGVLNLGPNLFEMRRLKNGLHTRT